MRLRLEATPDELWVKGDALVAELARVFSTINPDLSEALEKSLPPKEQDLKYPALRGLKAITTKEYDRMLKRMLSDIGKVLDQSISGTSVKLSKSSEVESLIKQLGPPPKDEDEEEEPEEEEEELEPGDYDPKTDTIVPEPEEEEEEEEETEKAVASQSEPLKSDFTKPIADVDALAYERVKRVLIGRGRSLSDFEESGDLYGLSVNELIDLVREEKAS